MRWALYILGVCMVVATAFWSYRITYGTQERLDEVAAIRSAIAAEREAIAVLSADWAWLNAPDRLEAKVIAHNDVLGLRPMEPDRFAELYDVPSPQPDDGMEPVALIDLDEPMPDLAFAPAPTPRPRTALAAASPADLAAAARARLTGWEE